MRIHQLTHLFSPDELAGASLYTDLARYLRDRGHDVRVTTTFSYYPALHYRPEDQGIPFRDEVFEGIPIRRVGMYLPVKHKGWRRLLPELSYAWQLTRYGRFPDWTPDVVITACPMLAQCVASRFLYPGARVPRLIVVQDFMVDAALELGILNGPGLGPLLRGAERWALRSARTVATLSPTMADKLRSLGRRTVVIPNWIHESLRTLADEAQHAATPRDKHRLFYSGNLGVKQGLPDFLSIFSEAKSGWQLDIRGGGAEATRVRAAVADQPNVSLGGLLDEPAYLRTLASATACLITQQPGVGANFLPSKLLPALAVGTPVLAMCEAKSPLGREVTAGGFGEVIPPGDTAGLRSVLARWAAEPRRVEALGRAAAIHAMKFSREHILGLYESELRALIAPVVPMESAIPDIVAGSMTATAGTGPRSGAAVVA